MEFTAGEIIEWILVREVFKKSSLGYRNAVYNLSFDCDVFYLRQLKVTDMHMFMKFIIISIDRNTLFDNLDCYGSQKFRYKSGFHGTEIHNL